MPPPKSDTASVQRSDSVRIRTDSVRMTTDSVRVKADSARP
jgi:hypothetical protein